MNAVSVPVVDKKKIEEYKNNLNEDKTKIYEIYEEIRAKGEQFLIEKIKCKEIDVKTIDNEGLSPLMLAVDETFSVECLQTLIDLGAEVNCQGSNGSTALHFA
mmetsp:Transcript_20669/g.18315  ORF Transcript_20669/g.18315 Transcript_20669/m.18315 type:complete len:103 (-) Transcript_20669:163-471(-)